MKRKIYIISILCLSVFVCSCQSENGFQEKWLESTDDVSITMNKRVLLRYDAARWQQGWSEHEFWAMNDDMKEYFKVTMDGKPVEGNTVGARLEFLIKGDRVREKKLKLTTMKIDGNGKIWLYSNNQKTGLIIGPME